jgi:hypothetical protein
MGRGLQQMLRGAIACFWIGMMAVGIAGCGSAQDTPQPLLGTDSSSPTTNPLSAEITEVSPPEAIRALKPFLDVYEPQVQILSPRDGAVLDQETVTVRFRVRDLPIYKDDDLGLGPHLHLILDDQPAQAIYDPEAEVVLEAVAPGSHTLRLVAMRPWDESFKNAGAFDGVSFDVFTATPTGAIDRAAPLLTYSPPRHSYGAEPILLDFYLTNTPLHLVAEADEAIADWRIRCTVNGNSFVFDQWQPIYLKGFKPGKNWIKLELINDQGDRIENAFNPAVHVVDYRPDGDDPLAPLIRGEVPLAIARQIVDPTYVPPTPPAAIEPEVTNEEEPPSPVPSPAGATVPDDASDTTTAPETDSETDGEIEAGAAADAAAAAATEDKDSPDAAPETAPTTAPETPGLPDANQGEPDDTVGNEEMTEASSLESSVEGSDTSTVPAVSPSDPEVRSAAESAASPDVTVEADTATPVPPEPPAAAPTEPSADTEGDRAAPAASAESVESVDVEATEAATDQAASAGDVSSPPESATRQSSGSENTERRKPEISLQEEGPDPSAEEAPATTPGTNESAAPPQDDSEITDSSDTAMEQPGAIDDATPKPIPSKGSGESSAPSSI